MSAIKPRAFRDEADVQESRLLAHSATQLMVRVGIHGSRVSVTCNLVVLRINDCSPDFLFGRVLHFCKRPAGRWRFILPGNDTTPPIVFRVEGRHEKLPNSDFRVFRINRLHASFVRPPSNADRPEL